MNIETLVLFDIDGTLIDTAGAGRRAMEAAFRDVYRLDGVAGRAAHVRYAGMTDPRILEAVARAVGIDDDRFRRTVDRLIDRFLNALDRELDRPDRRRRVLPGVRPLLDALAARRDTRLGLLTGNLERGARLKLAALDLDRYFDGGGFASDDGNRREIARIARERLAALTGIAFRPDQVVVVGDTEHDVDCARANGYRSVAVDSGWIDRTILEAARPDRLLDGLDDLPSVLEAIGLAPAG